MRKGGGGTLARYSAETTHSVGPAPNPKMKPEIAVETAPLPKAGRATQRVTAAQVVAWWHAAAKGRGAPVDDGAADDLALLLDAERQHRTAQMERQHISVQAGWQKRPRDPWARASAAAADLLLALRDIEHWAIQVAETDRAISPEAAEVVDQQLAAERIAIAELCGRLEHGLPRARPFKMRTWRDAARDVFSALDRAVQGRGAVSRSAVRFVVTALKETGHGEVTGAAVEKALRRQIPHE